MADDEVQNMGATGCLSLVLTARDLKFLADAQGGLDQAASGPTVTPRVDRFAQVMVRNNRYPVPVRLIGRRVRVLLHASDLVIYDGRSDSIRFPWGLAA